MNRFKARLVSRRSAALITLALVIGGAIGLEALTSAPTPVGCGQGGSCQVTPVLIFGRGYGKTTSGFDFLVLSKATYTVVADGLYANSTGVEFAISPMASGSHCDPLMVTIRPGDTCLVSANYSHPLNGTLVVGLVLTDGATYYAQLRPSGINMSYFSSRNNATA